MAKIKNSDKEEIKAESSIKDDVSKNLLGSLLNGYKDTHFNGIKENSYIISSGSLALDQHVKLRSGQIIKMGGCAEVGKTSQSLLFARNYMATVPGSKTIYINAEAKFGEEIRNRIGLTFTEDPEKWDIGTVFVFNCNILDTICDMLSALLKQMHENSQHLCIVLDSIDMLLLKSTLDKEMTDGKKPAGINYLTKELLRRLSHQIYSYNALFIAISQYSATFQLDPYAKKTPSLMEGNQTNALNHQVSYALYYRPRYQGDLILEKEKEKPDPSNNKILGVYAHVEIKKSASDSTGQTIAIPIRKGVVGSQIWKEKECVDAALYWNVLKRSGAWFQFSPSFITQAKEDGLELKEKIQGLNGVCEYFEEDKAICNWFYEKFKVMNES